MAVSEINTILLSIKRDLNGTLQAVREEDTKAQLMIHIGGHMVDIDKALAVTAALSDQVPKEQFNRAIKLLKQNTGLLCESGNLNNYRNLSDEELGKAWVETAKCTAEFLNEVEGPVPASTPVRSS